MIAFLTLIDDYEDKQRFQQLYYKYRGLMAYIAGEKVKSKEDIEDVLQEAFLYIAKNFNKVGEVESDSTKCYVAVITESIAINKYNSERKQLYHLNDYVDVEDVVDDDDFNLYNQIDLIMAIDNLNDEYRNLLYFTYVFGYTSKEISEVYGISANYIRKKIQFAKIEVKNSLKVVIK